MEEPENWDPWEKICPQCKKEKAIHWKSNVAVENAEAGHYYCEFCGWRSEVHETKIEEVKKKPD